MGDEGFGCAQHVLEHVALGRLLPVEDLQQCLELERRATAWFGEDSVEMAPVPASEDFSVIPDAFGCPYTYWGLGGFADWKNAPGNHSPFFAPDIHPTLDRGTAAIVVAASPWLIGSKG